VLQEEMRQLENLIIDNENFHQKVNDSIDEYENSMLRNIYSFYNEKSFQKAIFMCGAAHRKSISEKIKKSEIKLNWSFYNEIL
jgi:predicted ferric reductase